MRLAEKGAQLADALYKKFYSGVASRL